ncbi:ATP-binding protein [Alphaproteobacteria bacterium]|nr:ATP-binding protein [Alphaproteobacteria bacterium]
MNSRKFFPKTLFGRSLVIILIPVLILQFVLIYFFYERHWEDVGRRLALALGGQISFILDTLQENNFSENSIIEQFDKAEKSFLIKSKWYPEQSLKNYNQNKVTTLLDKTLQKSLAERINYTYKFNTKLIKNNVVIYVEINNGVLEFSVARKILYSSTIEVFIIWMLLTALFLLILALYFMKQQIKPLRNIILAADEFGKGNNNFELKPRGAYELRLLSKVFIKMRARIKNQISNRTQMLAGIGHDLRTPLTRMKLQVALLNDKKAIKSLSEDISEMRHMIDVYLDFAKGEEEEKMQQINIHKAVKNLIKKNNIKQSKLCKNQIDKNLKIKIRPLAMNRALSNIIINAQYYSNKKIIITSFINLKNIVICIEDDGIGIPKNKRDDVFKAFFRIDESRFSQSGNTGLGLTIARDIVQSHGGKITLSQSSLNGLKVQIFIPIS